MASSGRFFPFPSAFSTARSKDVNSWPFGIPRNLTPVSFPFFSKENSSFGSSVSVTSQESLSEHPATSFSNSVFFQQWFVTQFRVYVCHFPKHLCKFFGFPFASAKDVLCCAHSLWLHYIPFLQIWLRLLSRCHGMLRWPVLFFLPYAKPSFPNLTLLYHILAGKTMYPVLVFNGITPF